MKRLMGLILALSLLLTACGREEQTKGQPAGETVLPPTCAETVSETGDYAIVCEWEEYACDVGRITFFVENHTQEPLETGVDFRLETLGDNGAWYEVPLVQNAGWVALGLQIPAGERTPLECWFPMYDYDFSGGGTCRIVKELNGQTVAGSFKMTEISMISAQQPYGFAPLEELPGDYSAADTVGNEVVFTESGAKNLAAVEVFLDKSGRGVDCQLRTVQDYGEGTPMVIDVIHENDHFLWRMWSAGQITEQRFSYIVTDGSGLFLSNAVDWHHTELYNSDTAFLIPEGVTGEMLTVVEGQAAGRLEGSVLRYRVWSTDGVYDAALTTEPDEFSVGWQKSGEGSRGELFSIQKRDGKERVLTALEWQGSDLLLTCETVGADGKEHWIFSGESWTLTAQ